MASTAPTSATPAAPSVWRRARWPLCLALSLVGLGALVVSMHWDDRASLWVKERFQSVTVRQNSVWLPDYLADIDAKALPGMEDDETSDLAYNPATRTLFTVTGKQPFLAELSLDGDLLRKIPLVGWNNPEGVAVLGQGQLAIVDERDHDLTLVTVDAHTTSLDRSQFRRYDLGESANGNKGFEAVAWDPRQQRLLLGEERPPRLFTWSTDGHSPLQGSRRDGPDAQLDLRNLSALTIDPRTQHILALSADSNLLLELDPQGRQVSFMTLLGGFNGLANRVPRAEGVAMDEAGTLYVISEPNLFYRFKKP